ncbi:MAG TPA: 4'-phosphopantetheinyl transferase superfamily protein [Steroidobacteraceae bacterium]|nr:4'-phosphopantetheinyl transferase superfamily protein [Steroidobacteraceae bacterium]
MSPAAQPAAALTTLFPRGALAAELHGDPFNAAAPPAQADAWAQDDAWALEQAQRLLSDAEWGSIAHCAAARIRDFTAGRLCAHRALEALGIDGFSVLSAADRRVLWPPGISGSITHTKGYAAAVIGRLAEVGSLGLDCERIEEVSAPLWREICTSVELEQLARWTGPGRERAAALCFVAKEAFYKAQYALCAEPLGFDAVRIDVHEAAQASGAFQVHALRPLRLQRQGECAADPAPWTGRFRCHGGYLSAGIALRTRIE